MLTPDKDKLIPWLAVVFAGLVLGALGRYIALQQTSDTGTANLVFVIVLGGVVFIYFLFITLWESIYQLITRKLESGQVDDLPEEDDDEDDDDIYAEEQKRLLSEIYPYIGDDDETEDDPGDDDPVEEEIQPQVIATPAPQRPNWQEQREKEFQEKLSLFRDYTHYEMEQYVSEAELARLNEYIELFAREVSLPKDAVPMKPARLKNPDLYHFGWNMQNFFNVGRREDVVPWLQTVFSALKELEHSTIKGKLYDGYARRYVIQNIPDIPKFMASKRS